MSSEGEFLGEGSYGQVFSYTCKHTGAKQVVKHIGRNPGWTRDDMVHEALVMEELDHPHILRLLSWYEQDEQMTMVCDFCAGGELMDVVREGRRTETLPENWAAVAFRQLFEATVYCHSKGIVHKDLKTDNILLLTQPPAGVHVFSVPPHAVIADWGLAEIVHEGMFFETKGHEVAGTGHTMAPEVWNRSCGQKSDVWSLGCVLFQLFSNKMPFDPPDAQLAALPWSSRANIWIELHNKGPDWKVMDASKGAKDLCKGMLKVKERERLRAQKCREHAWIVQHSEWAHASRDTLRKTCGSLATWPGRHPFQKVMCMKLATKFGNIAEFASAFSAIDKDRSGTLSKQELVAALQAAGIDGDVRKAAAALDFKGGGDCSWHEFLAACLPSAPEDFAKALSAEYATLSSSSKLGLSSPLVTGCFEKLMALVEFQASIPNLSFNSHGRVTLEDFTDFFGPEPRLYRGNIKHGTIPARTILKAKRAPKRKPRMVVKAPEPLPAIVNTNFARQIVEIPKTSDSSGSSGSWYFDDSDEEDDDCEEEQSKLSMPSSSGCPASSSTSGCPATSSARSAPADHQPPSSRSSQGDARSRLQLDAGLLKPQAVFQTPHLRSLHTDASQSSTAAPESLSPCPASPRRPSLPEDALEGSPCDDSTSEQQDFPTMLDDSFEKSEEEKVPPVAHAASEGEGAGAALPPLRRSLIRRRTTHLIISLGEHHPFMDTDEFREQLARPPPSQL